MAVGKWHHPWIDRFNSSDSRHQNYSTKKAHPLCNQNRKRHCLLSPGNGGTTGITENETELQWWRRRRRVRAIVNELKQEWADGLLIKSALVLFQSLFPCWSVFPLLTTAPHHSHDFYYINKLPQKNHQWKVVKHMCQTFAAVSFSVLIFFSHIIVNWMFWGFGHLANCHFSPFQTIQAVYKEFNKLVDQQRAWKPDQDRISDCGSP